MAEFPSYATVLFDGYSETFDASVQRTEMERGVPKQRLLNSQVLMKVNATVFFQSMAEVAAFDDWYFDTIERIGWFDLRHPRTGATITARFESGGIGTLTPLRSGFGIAQRDLVIEYLR